jgi:RNA polymerase sigma factor (sigma-70 family)
MDPAGVSPSIHERNRLVEEHLWLVDQLAAMLLKRLPVHVRRDDLVQSGCVGLIQAAGRYDAGRGDAAFRTFASRRVWGSMVESVRRREWVELHHTQLPEQLPDTRGPAALEDSAARARRRKFVVATTIHACPPDERMVLVALRDGRPLSKVDRPTFDRAAKRFRDILAERQVDPRVL